MAVNRKFDLITPDKTKQSIKESINDLCMLFGCYTKVSIKSWFQYKVDATLRSLAVFLREATSILIIFLTFKKFNFLNGWSSDEMIFLYSFLFITYGVLIIFFTGLRDLDTYIISGSFDRYLLRPRGILFQIITSNSDWFAAIGHGVLGILLVVLSSRQVHIVWNLKTIVYYLATIVGGVLIQGAVFLFFASCTIYVIQADNARNIVYHNLRRFAGYPLSIYTKTIQILLVYVVPFAFVNYFPAEHMLNKVESIGCPSGYRYMTFFIGIIMYVIIYMFWRHSIKHYVSTGN